MASITSGFAAGIMGLTGLSGILLYIGCMILLSTFMHLNMSSRKDHIAPTTSWVWSEGFLSAFATYILIWTLAYDYIHVY